MSKARGSYWKHPKYKKLFFSRYSRVAKSGERVFELVCDGKAKTYESWQAAVRDGWKKA